MYNQVESAFLEELFHRRPIFQLHADKAEFRVCTALYRRSPCFGSSVYSQFVQTSELECRVVIAVDRVYADDAVAFFEKTLGCMKAYKTRSASHQKSHTAIFLHKNTKNQDFPPAPDRIYSANRKARLILRGASPSQDRDS